MDYKELLDWMKCQGKPFECSYLSKHDDSCKECRAKAMEAAAAAIETLLVERDI